MAVIARVLGGAVISLGFSLRGGLAKPLAVLEWL